MATNLLPVSCFLLWLHSKILLFSKDMLFSSSSSSSSENDKMVVAFSLIDSDNDDDNNNKDYRKRTRNRKNFQPGIAKRRLEEDFLSAGSLFNTITFKHILGYQDTDLYVCYRILAIQETNFVLVMRIRRHPLKH